MMDKSLEPMLGKCVFTNNTRFAWYPAAQFHTYKAPRLYLGGARLKTGLWVRAADLSGVFQSSGGSRRGVSGILGMDCLSNYCVQIDFSNGRMRFLDPDKLDTRGLGQAFAFDHSGGRLLIDAGPFQPGQSKSWIDTGDPNDFIVTTNLFQQIQKSETYAQIIHVVTPGGKAIDVGRFPYGDFSGKTYIDLRVGENPEDFSPQASTIGLHFLARHLVTLNFPKQMMYLKPERAEPLGQETGH